MVRDVVSDGDDDEEKVVVKRLPLSQPPLGFLGRA